MSESDLLEDLEEETAHIRASRARRQSARGHSNLLKDKVKSGVNSRVRV